MRRLLTALLLVLLGLVGAPTTTASAVACIYDAPTITRVDVQTSAVSRVESRQVTGSREESASRPSPASGPCTTPPHSFIATNNVIVDTNAVYNRPGTLGALQPGETPVMTRTTVGELANNAASGRLKPPGFANELGVVDDVMDVNTRINIRGGLEAIKPGQRGLLGDGSIGATAVNTGYPVITADKNFATVLEAMGVQVRRI